LNRVNYSAVINVCLLHAISMASWQLEKHLDLHCIIPLPVCCSVASSGHRLAYLSSYLPQRVS